MYADFAPTTQLSPFDDEVAPCGGVVRRWWRRHHDPLKDQHTGLLNRRGLLTRGDGLLAGGRHARAALLVFDFTDIPESADLWGPRAVQALLERVAGGMRKAAGRRGLAARTGPTQFAVLIPGACRQGAVDAVMQVFGQPCRIELDWQGEELVCVPDVAVKVWEGEPEGLEPLYAGLCGLLAAHHAHQLCREDFLRRERERHSRPFGVSQVQSLPSH